MTMGGDMGPGHLEKALKAIRKYLIGWFILSGLLLLGIWWGASYYLDLELAIITLAVAGIWIILAIIIGLITAKKVSAPLKALAQAILHVSPSPIPIAAPDEKKLGMGRELVANLIRQVYDYAAGKAVVGQSPAPGLAIQKLPVAVIGLDSDANITFANQTALEYVNTKEDIAGKNLYGLFDILFQSSDTLQAWIESARKNAITAQKYWHAIRITPFEGETKYFDLAASYSKQAGNGSTEVIISLFDQTDVYRQEDEDLSFIALAVHELRSPLTILRGYIEVFEDELSGKLDPQMQDFMQKMKASAENLTAFVTNILNVARVDQNQLSLKLHEEDWKAVLTNIVDTMKLRAKVHKKEIQLSVAENLPKLGVDRISIAEVVINLLDNAIKYSPPGRDVIKVSAYQAKDGLVETTVQDYGVGIPQSVLPHLFEKYQRNYRNRSAISGSGLGLYLSKALVNAHGGNIWVRSREGEGTIFGFTLVPFSKLAEAEKAGDNKTITRNAHGWIKNHSLSRR